ncbi:MAG: hypothetical protein H6R01_164 [Burkholderiaceae bacterium]|nr:hypothetical protein [Burkholderiaceae bacterium]
MRENCAQDNPAGGGEAGAPGRWEHFEHRADIGVRGLAASMTGAFEQAAMAMTAVITDPALVEARGRIDLHCQAPDDEILLADWLNALIFEMATRRMLFSRFEVHIDNHILDAAAWGEPVNETRHQPAVEVKGATFTELKVGQDSGGMWFAQCVVDV